MVKKYPEIWVKQGNDELVHYLRQYDVSFLVIGGTAVAVHGARDNLEVDDFDIMVDPTRENAERVLGALMAAQISVPFDARALARPGVRLPLKSTQYYAEILTPKKGVEFRSLLDRSVSARLRMHKVQVVGRQDLIDMKQQAVDDIAKELDKHQRDLSRLEA